MPRISVIMPVHNAQTHLALALGSILRQDCSDFEVLALNDGSGDGSLAILERAAARDARIRVVDRPHRGLIETLNEGIALATGEFIARMDADDIAYPRRFSRQLEAFDADPALALCGTNFDTLHPGDRVLRLGAPNATNPHDLRILARFCTALRHPTVMFRRGTIPEGMLRYDPSYPCAEDFDLFRRLAESCKLIQVPEPLLAYRLHQASVTSTRFAQMNRTHATILEENLARHYPSAAGTGFERIVSDLSQGTVAAGADLIRRLDRLALLQRPEDQEAFHLGTTTIFFFLLAQIHRGNRLDFAGDFIAQCGSRHRLPWQRRMLLDAAAAVPGLARWASGAVPLVSTLRRSVQSKPLRTVMPDYDRLLRTVAFGDGVSPGPAMGAPKGRIIFVQPALPSYRIDYFERLARRLGPRLCVYYSAEDLGVLTNGPPQPWAQPLGPMRRPLPGVEWQPGAARLPVGRGDVLVVCGAPRNLSTLLLLLRARLSGVRTVWWGQYWSASSRPWRFLLRMGLLRLAERVWFYTDEEVTLYQRRGGARSPRVASISNGLALDRVRALRRPFRPEERPLRIFFIGRLTPKTRLDLLLRALASPELADVGLDVVGEGEQGPQLRALAASLGLGERVRWHGATVDEGGIGTVANACRLFVYPGGVGLSLVHAMAYGLPAVLHDDRWTHMPEIAAFREGETGRAFRAGDAGSLADTVEALIRDDGALARASASAIATVEARFTTGEMAHRTLRLLQDLGVTLPDAAETSFPVARPARFV